MIAILAVLTLAAFAPPNDVTPPEGSAATLEQLQQVYDQSCSNREFGSYDDICDQLSHQVKAAQVEAERAARRRAAKPGRVADPGPAALKPASKTPAPGQTPAAPGA